MKRTLVVFVAALVAAGVALAAVTRQDAAGTPTTASLMPAYVQAAKYWNARTSASAISSSPTTATLMPAYVQAAKYWNARTTASAIPTTASLMQAYVEAGKVWRR
jgi:hypothetical protein